VCFCRTRCRKIEKRKAVLQEDIRTERLILRPFAYAMLANICYTFGGIFDVLWYRGHPRIALFRAGLYFSIALTATPGLWALYAWISTLVTGHKLP